MGGFEMEEWKDIPGYEGIYKISSLGNVYSYITKKMLHPSLSSTGYKNVQLYKHSKAKSYHVHFLVASVFLNKIEGCEVNHIDGNKTNNAISNLEWVTKKENTNHAIQNNLRKPCPMIGRKGISNPTSKHILQYSLSGEFIKEWCGISETARTLNCSSSIISSCLNNHRPTAKGFIWRYKESDTIPQQITVQKNVLTYQGSHTWTQKNPRKMHRIKQSSLDGKTVRIWDNYRQIVSETNFNNGNIYKVITGKCKTAYGFIWSYTD